MPWNWRAMTLLLGFSFGSVSVYAVEEPDTDQDHVSDYDDYCPHTPAGLGVWKPEHVASGQAQPNWVGCANRDGDFPQAGFVPPQRPVPEPDLSNTFYGKIDALFQTGTKIPAAQNVGANIGRCYLKSAPNEPMAANLIIVQSNANGPITTPEFEASSNWRNGDPTYYDAQTYRQLTDNIVWRKFTEREHDYSMALDFNCSSYVVNNGSYLIENFRCVNGQGAMCYYFLKKTP